MIIVHLTGGLGNQLFQYAIGKSLSVYSNEKLLFDVSSYTWDNLRKYELSVFNFNDTIAEQPDLKIINDALPFFSDRIISKVLRKPIPYYRLPIIREHSFTFDLNFYKFRKTNLILQGYWQSEKYFSHIRSIIKTDLSVNEVIFSVNMLFYKELIESSSSSVSIHIRRGDYVTNSSTMVYHGLCDLEYYYAAMKKIESQIETRTYFIFSDDKDFVKEIFAHKPNVVIIENIKQDYEELILMSKCNHNIIANSSFSWWGAWLNDNDTKIVIAPKKWFSDPIMQQQTVDLLPDSWIKI